MKFRKKHSSSEQAAVTKADLENMERKLSQQRTDSKDEGVQHGTGRAIRMMAKGISDIGKSLATPDSKQRPRIARMPGSIHEIPIAKHADFSKMKAPGLKNQNISGVPELAPTQEETFFDQTEPAIREEEKPRLLAEARQRWGDDTEIRLPHKGAGIIDWSALKFELEAGKK